MNLKRQAMPKSWPVPRKGTTFVVRPNLNLQKGLPVLVALRDILGIVETRKELKKAIHMKNILINFKEIKDEKASLTLFDILTLAPSNKNYKVGIALNGKFKLEEIDPKEAIKKIIKIVNKKVLKGKKTQLNLNDGRNLLSEIKCKVNDSIVLDLKEGKILSCLPLKEKSKIFIFEGKHAGEYGVIEKINLERKIVEIHEGDKNVNVLIKQLMVVE